MAQLCSIAISRSWPLASCCRSGVRRRWRRLSTPRGFSFAPSISAVEELAITQEGLVTNIVSFNVGVEMGQMLALTFILIGLTWWRTRPGFLRHAFMTNTLLMFGGFLLVGYQLSGYMLSTLSTQ